MLEPEKLPLSPFINRDKERSNYAQYIQDIEAGLTAIDEVLAGQVKEDRKARSLARKGQLMALKNSLIILRDDPAKAQSKYVTFPVPIETL